MGEKDKEGVEVSEFEGDENTERGNWSGKLDFLLSAIGYAVGLGNVWRFPYRAYENGGASFLIPYLIMLTIAGLPLFLMEMAFGQFSSQGPISAWRAVPLFKGVGWAMVAISFLTSIYYNMIIAYTIYYIFASFTSELPWQNCKPEWVEKYGCVDRDALNATTRNMTAELCKEWDAMGWNETDFYIGNCTKLPLGPSEIYWDRVVLDRSEGIDHDAHVMKWQLVLCYLFAWIIIFLCLIKGIKSSGKVVYFTATFPYIVLVILLIRNVTLSGAIEGIKFYIVPDFDRLADIDVWYSAAIQIFYSLGVAFGGLETMASYNNFKNNVYRDALIVAILNCSTSIFAGFVIFSVIGHMATRMGVEVSEVAQYGPGLAFIAYPEGIAMMPVAPLWSCLFFFMLFTLGLDSQFAMMEAVISAFVDEFRFLKGKRNRIIVTGVFCVLLFLLGLPQCSRAGVYVMNLFDWWCAGFSLLVVSLFEVIGIAYVYGWRRFCNDIEMMIGHKPNIYWIAHWLVITPIAMLLVILYKAVTNSGATYGNDYVYPEMANSIGWGMVGFAVIFIPVIALVEYCKATGFIDTMRKVLNPTPEWGPAVPKYRTGIYAPVTSNGINGDATHIDEDMDNGYQKKDLGHDNIAMETEMNYM